MPDGAHAMAALMHELIDYAGLFPPAAHNMAEAVERYARYRAAPHAQALGRFVVPAARLVEFEQALAALPPAVRGRGTWPLAALVSPPFRRDVASIAPFNDRGASGHDYRAHVGAIEAKVATPGDVEQAAREAPASVTAFFECPVTDSLDALLVAIKASGGAAKIRTGGIVPDSIVAPAAVARFIAACAAHDVAFKATAGLHHPVRATYPLTYEPDAPRATMNGFLNVFAAAVFARTHRLDAALLVPLLEETSPDAFTFSASGLSWRGLAVTTDQIVSARRFALGFGSCSFEEPIDDLVSLGLLLPGREP
jgi:hypothetical protein